MKSALVFLTLIIFTSIQNKSFALSVDPQSYGSEKRLRYWTYYPDTVYKYTGFLNYPTYIQFEDSEKINTISTPASEKWQFAIKGSRLFVKPLTEDANSVAVVITDKRTYFFEMHVKNIANPFDQRFSFGVHFKYPISGSDNKDGGLDESIIEYVKTELPDLSKPQNYNFNYTLAGSDVIAPIKIFDDGVFTYLEFRDKNATLPAIFGVDSKGYEYIMNFRVMGDYIILESVVPTLTLRNASDLVCVFNEAMKKFAELPKQVPEKLKKQKEVQKKEEMFAMPVQNIKSTPKK